MKEVHDLMEFPDNVKCVQSQLVKFIKCHEEANDMHESILNLNLPEDEVEKQKKYFHEKRAMFYDFIEEVKSWCADAGHPYVELKDNDVESPDNQSVASDDIKPEDSASNISCVTEIHSRSHSQLSKLSSTSSARIKTEALEEHMAALKKKHSLEAKEEELRREKEK